MHSAALPAFALQRPQGLQAAPTRRAHLSQSAKRRARSAPRLSRAGVDLRERRRGEPPTRKHRAALLGELESWLAVNGHPPVAVLTETPIRLDAALADYGQHMWSTDRTLGNFRETLNAIGKD